MRIALITSVSANIAPMAMLTGRLFSEQVPEIAKLPAPALLMLELLAGEVIATVGTVVSST
jgi:hypothetical protein